MGDFQLGLIVVAVASMLSGFSAALTQKALMGDSSKRSSLFLSAELAAYGVLFLLGNLYFSSELQAGKSLLAHWNLRTLVPVVTNVSPAPPSLFSSHLSLFSSLSLRSPPKLTLQAE